MWKAFRNSTLKEGHAPQARIIYDKFHVLSHLGKAMDEVRKREYARLSGKDRRFIKGQKYTLLSRWENLTTEGKQALEAAVPGQQAAEHGLPAQGVVRPALGLQPPRLGASVLRQLAGRPEVATAGALPRSSPRWSRPTGTASRPIATRRTRSPLGFVEGLNNKIRAIQRRAYGFRDEEYLRLKILTCMLPKL